MLSAHADVLQHPTRRQQSNRRRQRGKPPTLAEPEHHATQQCTGKCEGDPQMGWIEKKEKLVEAKKRLSIHARFVRKVSLQQEIECKTTRTEERSEGDEWVSQGKFRGAQHQ